MRFLFNKALDIVTCDKCGCLILEHHAQSRGEDGKNKIYFCRIHRVNWSGKWSYPIYDLKLHMWTGEMKTEYYRDRVECDENGEILGRENAKSKKN